MRQFPLEVTMSVSPPRLTQQSYLALNTSLCCRQFNSKLTRASLPLEGLKYNCWLSERCAVSDDCDLRYELISTCPAQSLRRPMANVVCGWHQHLLPPLSLNGKIMSDARPDWRTSFSVNFNTDLSMMNLLLIIDSWFSSQSQCFFFRILLAKYDDEFWHLACCSSSHLFRSLAGKIQYHQGLTRWNLWKI